MTHPAITRLEASLGAKVYATRRRYPTAILYTVRVCGTDIDGVGTTVHAACEAVLRNMVAAAERTEFMNVDADGYEDPF